MGGRRRELRPPPRERPRPPLSGHDEGARVATRSPALRSHSSFSNREHRSGGADRALRARGVRCHDARWNATDVESGAQLGTSRVARALKFIPSHGKAIPSTLPAISERRNTPPLAHHGGVQCLFSCDAASSPLRSWPSRPSPLARNRPPRLKAPPASTSPPPPTATAFAMRRWTTS